jgi:telomerase reverse transcriptase
MHKSKGGGGSLTSEHEIVTNASLYNSFHVLTTAYTKSPETHGFGIRSRDDIYHRLKAYTAQRKGESCPSTHTEYYIACLDMEKCFDTIDPIRLYNIIVLLLARFTMNELGIEYMEKDKKSIEEVTSYAKYSHMIHRYGVTQYVKSKKQLRSKRIRYVTPNNDLLHFEDVSAKLSTFFDSCILTDGVVHPVISNPRLLKLLRSHLFHHTIQVPTSDGSYSLCTQILGIPQGSILSPLLCNIYYGAMETIAFPTDKLSQLLETTLVMRQMDDYILISTDKLALSNLNVILSNIYSHVYDMYSI